MSIDPGTGSIRARVTISGRAGLTGPAPMGIAAGEAVWVLNGQHAERHTDRHTARRGYGDDHAGGGKQPEPGEWWTRTRSPPQAVEVLLDAIATSDGTRASATEQLLQVRVEDGILGSFEFDANGDRTAGAVTMYRIEKGKPRVHAVITPPAELLGRR